MMKQLKTSTTRQIPPIAIAFNYIDSPTWEPKNIPMIEIIKKQDKEKDTKSTSSIFPMLFCAHLYNSRTVQIIFTDKYFTWDLVCVLEMLPQEDEGRNKELLVSSKTAVLTLNSFWMLEELTKEPTGGNIKLPEKLMVQPRTDDQRCLGWGEKTYKVKCGHWDAWSVKSCRS